MYIKNLYFSWGLGGWGRGNEKRAEGDHTPYVHDKIKN